MQKTIYMNKYDNLVLDSILYAGELQGWEFTIDSHMIESSLQVRPDIKPSTASYLGSDVRDFCMFLASSCENFYPQFETQKWLRVHGRKTYTDYEIETMMEEFHSHLDKFSSQSWLIYALFDAYKDYCQREELPIFDGPVDRGCIRVVKTKDKKSLPIDLEYDSFYQSSQAFDFNRW